MNNHDYTRNGCERVLIFEPIKRPRVLSVAEAAAELNASEAYVRRLLLRERLYGTKVGFVWAIYPDDLESFKRVRRPPGRPRKAPENGDRASVASIADERVRAGTGRSLRQRKGPKRGEVRSPLKARLTSSQANARKKK